MKAIAVLTLMIIWGMFVLGGTVYLIQWHNWSAWWMLLAILLLGTGK